MNQVVDTDPFGFAKSPHLFDIKAGAALSQLTDEAICHQFGGNLAGPGGTFSHCEGPVHHAGQVVCPRGIPPPFDYIDFRAEFPSP